MTVFANNREVSAEKQGNKLIAAFPDTCFTPPEAPPTPTGVPVPYPNFGQDSDLTSGTGSVLIKGGAVSQENCSKLSKCTGDEAGAAQKKGIITSKNTGKIYAQAWSSDVKAEGKGVARFGDVATSNHASNVGDVITVPFIGQPGVPSVYAKWDCLVGKFSDIKSKCNEAGGQAHHIIPDEYIRKGTRDNPGEWSADGGEEQAKNDHLPSIDDACAICVGGDGYGKASGDRKSDTGIAIAAKGTATGMTWARGHGRMHLSFDRTFGNKPRPISDAVKIAKQSLADAAAYDQSLVDGDCAKQGMECVEDQYKAACEHRPKIKVESKTNKSAERFANMEGRLGLPASAT